jgi:hypothetical protein
MQAGDNRMQKRRKPKCRRPPPNAGEAQIIVLASCPHAFLKWRDVRGLYNVLNKGRRT